MSICSIYNEYGYKNRMEYLESLADDFNCPIENILALAGVLGEGEDFDGLVSALDDYFE